MNIFSKLIILVFFVLAFVSCAGAEKKNNEKLPNVKEFVSLPWPQKISVIDKCNPELYTEHIDLIRVGLQGEHVGVLEKSIEKIGDYKINAFRDSLYITMGHPSPIVRWKSVKAFGNLNIHSDDIVTIVKMSKDKDWLVRESALRVWRNYKKERDRKKYFFDAIFRLRDNEPAVLSQVYETLYWYDDARAMPFLYKRSFHTSDLAELISIVRSLGLFVSDRRIKNRLVYLSRRHKSVIVRMSARDALKQE